MPISTVKIAEQCATEIKPSIIKFIEELFSSSVAIYAGSQGCAGAELDDISFAMCDSLEAVGTGVYCESIEYNKSRLTFNLLDTGTTVRLGLSFLAEQFEILVETVNNQKTHSYN
jgi:hypothetical protein